MIRLLQFLGLIFLSGIVLAAGEDESPDSAIEEDLREMDESTEMVPPSTNSNPESVPSTSSPPPSNNGAASGSDQMDNLDSLDQIPKEDLEKKPEEITSTNQLKEVSFNNTKLVSTLNLSFELSPENLIIRQGENSKQLIIDIPKVSVRKLYIRPIDTSEFPSTVTLVTPFEDKTDPSKNRLIVTLNSEVNHKLEKDPSGIWKLVVENTPGGIELAAQGDASAAKNSTASNTPDGSPSVENALDNLGSKGNYVGSLMTLSVKDAEIKDVLRLIAEVSGFSIIFGDDVNGKVSLSLKDVPWDQVLEIVLETKGLGSIRHENVLRVTSLENLMNQRQMEAKIDEAKKVIEQSEIKVFPIKFADPQIILDNVKNLLSKDRGSVSLNKRTNSIVVSDHRKVVEQISGLVSILDIRMPQVEISSKIVEADESFSRKLGVNWVSEESGKSNYLMMGFSPSVGMDPTMQLKSVIGSAGALGKLNTILSLAENKNQITIISNPKVTVINNKEAFIVQGKKVPYYTSRMDSNGNVTPTVDYIDANLELKVTPQISPDGTVLMVLSVHKNVPLPTQAGLPPEIDVKSSNTEVMVNDGETIVLGGIYQDSKEKGESGVPVLKDIPLLGWLFKSWKKIEMRKELLIFVTPRVLAHNG